MSQDEDGSTSWVAAVLTLLAVHVAVAVGYFTWAYSMTDTPPERDPEDVWSPISERDGALLLGLVYGVPALVVGLILGLLGTALALRSARRRRDPLRVAAGIQAGLAGSFVSALPLTAAFAFLAYLITDQPPSGQPVP